MSIKIGTGKLILPAPLGSFLQLQLQENNISLLDIMFDHTMKIADMPFHHRDPFDRLLIAQSLVEKIPLVSADRIFDLYGVSRIW